MKIQRILFFGGLFLGSLSCFGQDVTYARQVIEKLASRPFAGRGYVKHGDKKAAKYIALQFKKNHALPFGNTYMQTFRFSVNTFPGNIKIKVNNKKLKSGREFMVYANSPSASGQYKLIWFNKDTLDGEYLLDFYKRINCTDKAIVANRAFRDSLITYPPPHATGMIFRTERKLWWYLSNARSLNDHFTIDISKDALPENTANIDIDYKTKYIKDYQAQNVIAYVKGKHEPDSFIVFTAHYDHLGFMGKKTYFPGANDNASGVAMIIDLARHYGLMENQPHYSIAFIALAAEETGLIGSKHYVNHPLFPLKKIKFLINLDMVGTGSEGITVVNGSVFDGAFEKLTAINSIKAYLKNIKSRGESCNSDHCPFYLRGVPAVFIYTRGKEFLEYHNPDDQAAQLPLTAYENLFRLLVDFADTL